MSFVGCFVSFDDKFDVKGDFSCAFGPKEGVKIMLKFLSGEIRREKKDFVNW